MGDAPVWSRCTLLRNPWLKPAGVLEHGHEGETYCWFCIFRGHFLLTASLRRRMLSMCISLFKIAIPVNYTSEFREIFETTTYNWERRIQCVLSLGIMPEIDYDCSCQTPYLTRSGHERRGSSGSRHQDERTHWISVAEYAGLGQFNLWRALNLFLARLILSLQSLLQQTVKTGGIRWYLSTPLSK